MYASALGLQDATKTTFKSPARLESMMQDIPLQLSPEDKVRPSIILRICTFLYLISWYIGRFSLIL